MQNSQQPAGQSDRWADGAAYEAFIGRWSRRVAPAFLAWLGVEPGARWVDVGCGSGALTQAILDHAAPSEVRGLDRSAAFVRLVQETVRDARASFVVADAQALPLESGRYDAVVSGLVLNFIPDQAAAVREMARVAREGGTVAAYVWDYGGKMELLRHFWDAVVALDPAAAERDEVKRFPLCRPEPLRALFEGAGLGDVAVAPLDVETTFRDFDDLWRPFLGGQGPSAGYVVALAEDERAALRERLRDGLPFAPDGSIPLVARAWAVRGVRREA